MLNQKIKKIIKKSLGLSKSEPIPNLNGDRNIEWSWCIKYLPHNKKVLDVGCCYSIISPVAARFGNQVTGVDLNNEIDYSFPNFKLILGNIVDLNFQEKFDCIVLASTVEHIGLSGRYNSPEDEDGDLKTMASLKKCLATDGEVIVTIPFGKDGVFKPFHRVYGRARLPKLFSGFIVLEREFWIKSDLHNWSSVSEEWALNEQGLATYYGLGLFRLKLDQK